MMILARTNTTDTTSFAEFIRNASSGDKKRVYNDVLKKATERQLKVLNQKENVSNKS